MVKVCTFVVLALALAGCKQGGNIDSKEAIRQGVIDYLAGRTNLNISSMNVDVTSVSFKENEAEAVVSFSPKGAGSAGQGMSMRYTLERKGSRWVVKARTDSGQHGGAMAPGQNPHGMAAPEGSPQSPGGALPPGHPAVPKK